MGAGDGGELNGCCLPILELFLSLIPLDALGAKNIPRVCIT
jgi:hypothetical protein